MLDLLDKDNQEESAKEGGIWPAFETNGIGLEGRSMK